jgi:hypothetical protein
MPYSFWKTADGTPYITVNSEDGKQHLFMAVRMLLIMVVLEICTSRQAGKKT